MRRLVGEAVSDGRAWEWRAGRNRLRRPARWLRLRLVDEPAEVSRRTRLLLEGPRGRVACAAVGVLVEPTLEWPADPTDRYEAAAFVEQLGAVDVDGIAGLGEPLVLLDALGTAVDSALYWEEPGERDELLGHDQALAALEPIARALVEAPAARWWWSPLDEDTQSIVRWLDEGRRRAHGPELAGTPERLRRWRADTLAEERRAHGWSASFEARHTGAWWSTPALSNVTATSRGLGGLPAVQLELVEDSLGWDRARVAPVGIQAGCRVVEILEPRDWTDLVDAYPLDVDRSRRHDWWRATGARGPWQIPDWFAVSHDHDAVHLSVAGYLAGAGRALPTRDGGTILAGFDPDLTYWLADVVTQTAPPVTWRRGDGPLDQPGWVPAPTRPGRA